ncbi:helicase [Phlyctochytrium bullatum]|nr:helicase [Phlyctochytrium bullatum]
MPAIDATGVRLGSNLLPPPTSPPAHMSTHTGEAYAVVMRKKPRHFKKRKTWELDGFLAVTPDITLLFDSEGKQLRRFRPHKTHHPHRLGRTSKKVDESGELCIGDWEMEVSSSIKFEDYLSGKCFTGAVLAAAEPPPEKKPLQALKKPFQPPGGSRVNSKFKSPLADASNLGTPGGSAGKPPEGSIVLPRPPDRLNAGKKMVHDVYIDPLLARFLRPHQVDGVKFLYECVMGYKEYKGNGAILADDIEFKKWLGDERVRVMCFDNPANVTTFNTTKAFSILICGCKFRLSLVTPTQFPDRRLFGTDERLRTASKQFANSPVDIIIADEGHRLKNSDVQAFKVLASIQTRKRVILSGTPVQLHRLTSLFILRRTSDSIKKFLPPKQEFTVFLELSDLQQVVYAQVLSHRTLRGMGMGAENVTAQRALAVISLLTKVAKKVEQDPGQLVDELDLKKFVQTLDLERGVLSSKLQLLDQLLTHVRKTSDEKVVVVSNWTQTLDVVETLMHQRHWSFSRLDGKTNVKARQDLVTAFNSPTSKTFCMLLSAKAGGEGISLIGASRLILFDINWNPAVCRQAQARIWREGQQREVRIYRFLAANSIEEKVFQRQLYKTTVGEGVLGVEERGERFEVKELKDLFTSPANAKEGSGVEAILKGAKDWVPTGPTHLEPLDPCLAAAMEATGVVTAVLRRDPEAASRDGEVEEAIPGREGGDGDGEDGEDGKENGGVEDGLDEDGLDDFGVDVGAKKVEGRLKSVGSKRASGVIFERNLDDDVEVLAVVKKGNANQEHIPWSPLKSKVDLLDLESDAEDDVEILSVIKTEKMDAVPEPVTPRTRQVSHKRAVNSIRDEEDDEVPLVNRRRSRLTEGDEDGAVEKTTISPATALLQARGLGIPKPVSPQTPQVPLKKAVSPIPDDERDEFPLVNRRRSRLMEDDEDGAVEKTMMSPATALLQARGWAAPEETLGACLFDDEDDGF